MKSRFPNINTLWAHVLVDEAARCGMRHCVVSPGSRSTPLAVAFAEHPDIKDFSILDERSAAFFALGLSQSTGVPVGLVCTSGTAAANYLPAVCEADHACVPLMVLTADRPAHLQDAGSPQTMDQLKLYGGQVRWFHNLAQPEADELKLRSLRSTVCHAMALAGVMRPGPVHLNIPFRKPLEPTEVQTGVGAIPADLPDHPTPGLAGRIDGSPFTRYVNCFREGYDKVIARLTDLLRRHPRALIVAGPDAQGLSYKTALMRFVATTKIPVLAEATSQMRFNSKEEHILGSAGLFLRSGQCRAIASAPLILHLGRTDTLKPIQDFLSNPNSALQIMIGSGERRSDYLFTSACNIIADESTLLEGLSREFSRRPLSGFDRNWSDTLRAMHRASVDALHHELDARTEMFEGHVYHDVAEAIPDGTALFVSSSMPIRDLETFVPELHKAISVHFNRGLNGIDGVTSTALGVSRGRDGGTVLITGDVAFLHDLNGILAAQRGGARATIVVVNNNGGEIFGTLPIGRFEPAYTQHFQTPHGITMQHAAELFGAAYTRAETREQLRHAVARSFEHDGVHVVEVCTAERQGIPIRKEIFSGICSKLDALFGDIPLQRSETAPLPEFPLAWHRLRESGDAEHPIVLLHGFSRDTHMWKQDFMRFADGPAVYAVDLMGHGASPAPDFSEHASAYSLEYQTAQLITVLDRIGAERVHVVGYSMGGRLALHAAIAYPGRFASLSLLSASPGIEDADERMQRFNADNELADRIEREGLEAFVDSWLRTPAFSTLHRLGGDVLRKAKTERMRQNARGLAGSLRGMGQGAQPPLWSSLPELNVPTLLLAGMLDTKYCGYAEIMQRLAKNSIVCLIPDAGHDLVAEAGREVMIFLNEFFRGI